MISNTYLIGISVCYTELLKNPTNSTECDTQLIGDKICQDACNHPGKTYNFDGGDCCFENVETGYCDNCVCYSTCTDYESTKNMPNTSGN